ncbi:MAG: heavy metal-binding domain-containing protein [Sphingobacteriales bacterium JAD_PAG50586_3]|nr:MAG: heavy metal-binding domain-containing protein [Sphingobacteriales bacterium JAD_PAG50586_3]
MKYALTILLASMLLTFSVNAQTKQWLDAGFRVTANEKDASYYQIVNKDGTYKVYYTNGTVQQEGKFISFADQYINGTVKFYDDKGIYLRSRDYVRGLIKPVPMHTGDIKEPYTYIGLVYQYEQPGTAPTAYDDATRLGMENLAEKCRDLGADAVINTRIELSKLDATPRITLYGTAVKIK